MNLWQDGNISCRVRDISEKSTSSFTLHVREYYICTVVQFDQRLQKGKATSNESINTITHGL